MSDSGKQMGDCPHCSAPAWCVTCLRAEVERLRAEQRRAALFRAGDFTLASGAKAKWKIECDALTPEDWAGLARIASEALPPFGVVEGVPRGGLPFADALHRHVVSGCGTLLIAEDVVTTGGSMERFRAGRDAVGVAAFCRGRCPDWVVPLFRLAGMGSQAEIGDRLKHENARLRAVTDAARALEAQEGSAQVRWGRLREALAALDGKGGGR